MKNPKFKDVEMKNFWDSFEGFYQMGAQKHRIYMLDLLKKKGVRTLLDNGCGTAPIYEMIKDTPLEGSEVGSEIKQWDFKYKGTDYSEGMIAICKDNFPEGDFEVEDARKLNEKDNSWDCVLLLHCLDHLDDYQSAIAEAARVASKYVCIILWRGFLAEGTHLNDRNMMNKNEGEEPWEDTHLQEYSRGVLLEEFKKNNLVIEHEVSGDEINSDASKYNWLVLLRKESE